MTAQLITTFTAFALTEEDTLEGSIYTSLQTKVLQNMLAAVAESKLALEYDVTNPSSFIQQEAFLAGQLAILRQLIDTSASCAEAKNKLM